MAKIDNEYTLDVKQFKKATDTIVKQNKKVEKSNEKVEDSTQKVAKGLTVVDKEAGVYRNSSGRLVDANGRFIKSNKGAEDSLGGLSKGMKKSEEGAYGLSDALGAIGLAGAVSKGIDLTKDAVKTYETFQEEMLRVKAISGATGKQYDQLNKQAQELGATTAFSASQAAEAQKFFALAGFEVNEILAATPKLMQLAAASGEDLGTVSDIVSDQMTAFGLSAEQTTKMVDSLAKTATTSNTTVGMLGEALEQGGGTAASFNASLDDTLAILGVMANRSIKGSKAGNALKNLFLRLGAPTDAAAESLQEYNIQVFDSEKNMRGMTDILADVQKEMKGMNDEQKAAFLTTVFGRESLAGINAVLETSVEELKNYSKEITNAKGATEGMADITMEGLQGQLKEVRSMMEGIKIASTEANEANLNQLIGSFKELEGVMTNVLTMVIEIVTKTAEISLKPIKAAEEAGSAIGEVVNFLKTGKSYPQMLMEREFVEKSRAGEMTAGAGEARIPSVKLDINVTGDGTGITDKQLNNQVIPALENVFNQNMLSDFNMSNRNKKVK